MTDVTRVPTKRVMTMTRVFEAPRDLVWRVYTEPGPGMGDHDKYLRKPALQPQ